MYFNLDFFWSVAIGYAQNDLGFGVDPAYYGGDYWKIILDRTGRNLFLVWSKNAVSRKFYGTKPNDLFNHSMTELRQIWHDESQKPNTSTLSLSRYAHIRLINLLNI